uniref:Galectin domain-containing protein n=1 Tax=Globodera rostochiensis TaxID=31243 RepID=A0A914HL29_GLORO
MLIPKIAIIFVVFCSSSCQKVSNLFNTVILSEEKNQFETDYDALDQCHAKTMGQTIHSFSFNFQIVGNCKKGMLICYPGTLEAKATNFNYGMAAGIQFRVENKRGNSVAAKCAEKHRLVCQSNNEKFCTHDLGWHGIRVSRPINYRQVIRVEMSITDKSYEFNLLRRNAEFRIVLGNQHNLWTNVTDEFGQRIELSHDDDKLRDAFLTQKAEKGAKLSNYVGLWMLGLDVLPMLSRRKLQLHAYRDCACEMHAWFLHPYETPKIPGNASFAPTIPKKCAITMDDAEFKLKASAKIGDTIQIKFRLNKNANFVLFHLKDKNKHLMFCMNFTDEHIALNSTAKGSNVTVPIERNRTISLAQNRDKYLSIAFVVHPYFFELIVINETFASYFPSPTDWWKVAGQTEGIQVVTLTGDVYSGYADAQIANIKNTNKNGPAFVMRKFCRLNASLNAGDQVIFRGQSNANARYIEFHLLQNTHVVNDYIGTALLIIQLNFTVDGQKVFLEDKYQHWSDDENQNVMLHYNGANRKEIYVLQRGSPFELRFILNSNDTAKTELLTPINMTINVTLFTDSNKQPEANLGIYGFKNEYPIDYIGASGDLTLFAEPEVKRFGKRVERVSVLTLDPLLAVGDSILVEGFLVKNSRKLRICLLRDTFEPETENISIPLQITFEFKKKYNEGVMVVYSERRDKNFKQNFLSPIFAGEEFNLEIRAHYGHYAIHTHGAFVFNLAYELLRPWATNRLRVGRHGWVSRRKKSARRYAIMRYRIF